MRFFLSLILGLAVGCGCSSEPSADSTPVDDGATAAADATAAAS